MALSPTSSRAAASGGAGAATLIGSLVLGSAQASFDTNTILGGAIAATYNHLEIVALLRTDEGAFNSTAILRFNNDSGTNYEWSVLTGTNSLASSSTTVTATGIASLAVQGASSGAGNFTPVRLLVPNYRQTVANKSVTGTLHETGPGAGTTFVRTVGGCWLSTAAITRVQLLPGGGTNFAIGSAFYLYGLT